MKKQVCIKRTLRLNHRQYRYLLHHLKQTHQLYEEVKKTKGTHVEVRKRQIEKRLWKYHREYVKHLEIWEWGKLCLPKRILTLSQDEVLLPPSLSFRNVMLRNLLYHPIYYNSIQFSEAILCRKDTRFVLYVYLHLSYKNVNNDR